MFYNQDVVEKIVAKGGISTSEITPHEKQIPFSSASMASSTTSLVHSPLTNVVGNRIT
jgi:hypothetical protein